MKHKHKVIRTSPIPIQIRTSWFSKCRGFASAALLTDTLNRPVNTRLGSTSTAGTGKDIIGLVSSRFITSRSSVFELRYPVFRDPLMIQFVLSMIWTDVSCCAMPRCFDIVCSVRHTMHSLLVILSIVHSFILLLVLLGVLFVLKLVQHVIFFVFAVRNLKRSRLQTLDKYFWTVSREPPLVLHILSTGETSRVRRLSTDSKSHDTSHVHRLSFSRPVLHYRNEVEDFVKGEDILLIPNNYDLSDLQSAQSFTAYKPVDKRVTPISGTFPQDAIVHRKFPHNPLEGLPILSRNPPDFMPTKRITADRLKLININGEGFLWPEEEKLFTQVMVLNEAALAFEETDRGTLREDYFSPYIMPTIPHSAWEERNIPIPPGIKDKVIELLKHKMDAGVYEHCQSAYRSKWFCVLKKSGKLRIVHDLQALNAVSIRDAGGPPILDDFVEPFAGHQCYLVEWAIAVHGMYESSQI